MHPNYSGMKRVLSGQDFMMSNSKLINNLGLFGATTPSLAYLGKRQTSTEVTPIINFEQNINANSPPKFGGLGASKLDIFQDHKALGTGKI